MENQIHMEIFRSLHAHPTPMAFPELFTALQQGTVDGQENPITVIVSARFSEVQKFLSMTRHSYTSGAPLVSNDLHRKCVVSGKSVSVRVEPGGRRILITKNNTNNTFEYIS